MDDLKRFVMVEGASLINRAARSLGWGRGTIFAIEGIFWGLINGVFGHIIALALFPVLYVYRLTQSVSISLPSWLTRAVDFVRGEIIPAWDWVRRAAARVDAIYSNLSDMLSGVVSGLLGAWQGYINYLGWLVANLGHVFGYMASHTATWAYDLLPQWVRDVITSARGLSTDVLTWLQSARTDIAKFLADPARYIRRYLPDGLDDIITLLQSDMRYLAWLLTDAKRRIVEIVDNPAEWINKHITDNIIELLEKAILKRW